MKKFLLFFTVIFFWSCGDDITTRSTESNGSQTLSGSYANLLAVGDFLYAVSEDELITFNIETRDNPVELDRQTLEFGVESLLHRQGVLFVGSRQSMYIYLINDQGIPELKSETPYVSFFEGFTPCDPIVANDTLAIASLSSLNDGGPCGGRELNELRFFDITNIEDPVQFNTVDMLEPKGLGLDNNILFVCEASNGLKIFDIQNGLNPELLYHFDGFETFDVIPTGEILLVVGPDELYEFDYSDISDVRLLSTIEL